MILYISSKEKKKKTIIHHKKFTKIIQESKIYYIFATDNHSNLIIMKNVSLLFIIGLLCTYLSTSCEKPIINEKISADEVRVVFHVVSFSQTPLTTSNVRQVPVRIDEACSRLSFAIYDGNTKVKSVNQTKGSNDFGTLSLVLPKGNYRLVAIAHNGTGTATISSPNKITFPNNKCTDTFYICEDFSVSDNSEFDLILKRAVAMFRFVIEDTFPENIHQMKFYYTGGSSTFDATTGYGCVNSKQTEYREINDEMGNNEKQFDLFTFPHAEEDTLKMTITALSSTDVTIKERNFTSIPVKKNYITQYSGTFFDSTSSEGDLNIHFQVDTTWIQYSHRY